MARTTGSNIGSGEVHTSALAVPARVTVELPASAELFVNDVRCPLTSGTRSFTTPELQPNQKYFYTIRINNPENGQTVSRRVIVSAGQHVQVNFNQPRLVDTVSR